MIEDRGSARVVTNTPRAGETVEQTAARTATRGGGKFSSDVRKVERYQHHGREVAVMSHVKGRHREMCLCMNGCDFFKPGESENCPIAQANYDLCRLHGLVAPVMECPRFRVADGW